MSDLALILHGLRHFGTWIEMSVIQWLVVVVSVSPSVFGLMVTNVMGVPETLDHMAQRP